MLNLLPEKFTAGTVFNAQPTWENIVNLNTLWPRTRHSWMRSGTNLYTFVGMSSTVPVLRGVPPYGDIEPVFDVLLADGTWVYLCANQRYEIIDT